MTAALENKGQLDLLTPDRFVCNSCPEAVSSAEQATQKLATSGFAVLKQLLNKDKISELREIFYSNMLSSESKFGRIYRYRLLEKNKVSELNQLLNPYSNLQLESKHNNNSLENYFIHELIKLITSDAHIPAIKTATGHNDIRLLTWNLFHVVSPFTPPHQDCIFFNSSLRLFELLGIWIALEDIPAGASPLYLQRNSHIKLSRFAKNYQSITPEYTSKLIDNLVNNSSQIIAPSLQAGDCIIWDSRTVHGSLLRTDINASRLSITAHFEPHIHNIFGKIGKFESPQYRNLAKSRLFEIGEIKKINLRNNVTFRAHRTRASEFFS